MFYFSFFSLPRFCWLLCYGGERTFRRDSRRLMCSTGTCAFYPHLWRYHLLLRKRSGRVPEKFKIFVKPPIRRKSHTALPTHCAVSRSTLASESKPTLAKVLAGFASTMRARSFTMALASALPGQSSQVVSFD